MDKLLIVDDNHDLRAEMRGVLEAEGFHVIEAAEGISAIELFKVNELDAVLLDLKMPGMDGMEVFKELQRIDSRVPVIILTGFGDTPTVFEAAQSGVYRFFDKPPDFEKLVMTLKKAVSQKKLIPLLSERQLEVLKLVAVGKKLPEMASKLGIVERTVKFHLNEAMNKLGAINKTQAVAIAVQHGLIEIET